MFFKRNYLVLFLLVLFATPACALQTLFYTLRNVMTDPIQWQSLQAHYQQINILIPQAFAVDKGGKVSGSVAPQLVTFAHSHNIKLLVLVTNQNFDRDTVQKFLQNETAQTSTITTLVNNCKQGNYDGVQFDFENIPLASKKSFSKFFTAAATSFHQNNLLISAAVIPILPGKTRSAFAKRRFENWSGAYDYGVLGKYGDFVTLMAYDQHQDGTTPGPVASIRWDQQIIQYALQHIPRQKIFLGIPVYSDVWYTGMGADDGVLRTRADQISFAQAQGILNRNRANFAWDPEAQVPYAVFDLDNLYEYIFAENAQSFKAKVNLAKSFQLGGIAVWRLGMEDPEIWQTL